ncbi:MAG: hypothetical protein AB7E77_05910 [Desulfobulbus sp.]
MDKNGHPRISGRGYRQAKGAVFVVMNEKDKFSSTIRRNTAPVNSGHGRE